MPATPRRPAPVTDITADELTRLPEGYRVLLLSYEANNGYAKIAEDNNIPIGTVRSRIARGRARIVAMRAEASEVE